jgi:hypothetical protein
MAPSDPIVAAARLAPRRRDLESPALLLACVTVPGCAAWGAVCG